MSGGAVEFHAGQAGWPAIQASRDSQPNVPNKALIVHNFSRQPGSPRFPAVIASPAAAGTAMPTLVAEVGTHCPGLATAFAPARQSKAPSALASMPASAPQAWVVRRPCAASASPCAGPGQGAEA